MEGEERRVLLLAAEAAAGDGLRHVDAVVGEAEDPLDPLLDVEGALERAHDVRALARPRRRSSRSARCRRAPGRPIRRRRVTTTSHPSTRLRRAAPLRDQVALEDVVGRADHLARREGVVDRQDRRERLDAERDVPQRLLEPEPVLAGEEGDRLVGVADLVLRQDRLVGLDDRDGVDRDVVGGDDGDPAPVEGGVEVDAEEAAARRRRFGRSRRRACPGRTRSST